MPLSRRDFVQSTLLGSLALAGGAGAQGAEGGAPSPRDLYELRCYRLKPGASAELLHRYLGEAFVPALVKRGVTRVGVFTEIVVDQAKVISVPKPDSPVWVLVAHADFESFVAVSADLPKDPSVKTSGASYLQAKKQSPAFDRIDTWLLRAFAGMPVMEIPSYSKERVATRVFEMRDYESHSELKALSKMAMFDDAEIEIMRSLGMGPVFFGQALAGPNLPHLRYITSGPDLATHLAGWKKFGPDPRWIAIKDLPQYAENTSQNTARFLTPTPYSLL